jgi:hypothetical protein
VDATSRKYRRRRPLIDADGVVRNDFDHPVCSSFGTGPFFLVVAATPPPEEGSSSGFTISSVKRQPTHTDAGATSGRAMSASRAPSLNGWFGGRMIAADRTR